MENSGIVLRKAVLHVLDNGYRGLILSDHPLDLVGEQFDFLRNILLKVHKSDTSQRVSNSTMWKLICMKYTGIKWQNMILRKVHPQLFLYGISEEPYGNSFCSPGIMSILTTCRITEK